MIIYSICLISLRIIPSRPICIIANGKILFFLWLNSILFYIYVCIYILAHHISAVPWAVVPRLLCPWNFPGKDTGAGCHYLLQGIFRPRSQTNTSFISCIGRQILYQVPPGKLLYLHTTSSLSIHLLSMYHVFDINGFDS